MLVFTVLLFIFVQDVRSRSVYWVLFPVLALLFTMMNFLQHHLFADQWQPVLINCTFLLFQFFIVSVYFSIKNKQWVNVTVSMLGWGDILFLLSVAFYLSALNFLFFYIVSLIAVLLIWALWQNFDKEKEKRIPLAGLQALICALFLTGDWWSTTVDLTNDTWLFNLIMK